jgi:hypothetical protein
MEELHTDSIDGGHEASYGLGHVPGRGRTPTLFSHNIFLRNESRLMAEFSDFFTLFLLNESLTPCYAMFFLIGNRKINPDLRIKYDTVIRYRNLLLCTMSYIAFYFFFR